MRQILFAAFAIASQAGAGTLSPFFSTPSATIRATAVDAANNLFITGYVGPEFPGNIPTTPGAYLSSEPACPQNVGCTHSFVAKISSSGTLIFSTYLGDASSGDEMYAIAVDSAGNIFVAGEHIFGLSPGGLIQKLSPDGSKLLGSYTFAGGTPLAITTSASGDVYVAGQTLNPSDCSCSFSTTPGAFQTTSLGFTDAFVIRFGSSLSQPIYATLLGGRDDDSAAAIAVDSAGNAYVTGSTANAGSFPLAPVGYVQPGTGLASDAFVVELNPSGSALIFSALFDPSSNVSGSIGLAIAIDNSGVYVMGDTSSANVSGSQGAFFQAGLQFVAKLTPDGSSLIYQTLVPAFSSQMPFGIAIDSSGNLLLLSQAGAQVPTTPDAFAPCAPSLGATFIMQFDSAGTLPIYSSYLPGGLAIRGDGQAWYSDSSGAVNSFNIHDPLPTSIRCVADQLSGLSGPIAPGKLVKLLGLGIGPDTPATMQLDSTGEVAVGLNGVNVYFNGIAAPLLSVSANEIDAVVPFENMNPVEFPTSTVVMLKNGVEIDGAPVPVAVAAPVFYADSQGCLTAFNADGTVNSSTQPAALGSAIWVYGEGAGLMRPAVTGAIGTGQRQLLATAAINLFEQVTMVPGGTINILGPATIDYAADVPGYVEGVFELQAVLPSSFSVTGQVSVQMLIDNQFVSNHCLWVKPAN